MGFVGLPPLTLLDLREGAGVAKPFLSTMGSLKKKRRLKMNKHKRRKRSKASRHKKRLWG